MFRAFNEEHSTRYFQYCSDTGCLNLDITIMRGHLIQLRNNERNQRHHLNLCTEHLCVSGIVSIRCFLSRQDVGIAELTPVFSTFSAVSIVPALEHQNFVHQKPWA
uniref:Uncharacterized protein n=1 Tax=Romanomermis culicivorax TaxID=13658 RepID=A0A915IAV9_ROMCU